jgi:Kdo2-lipid IVA lauroyltransferase/acyltransferase
MIVIYWLYRLSAWLTNLAPRRMSFAFASTLGTSAYYIMRARRRVARENFSHVLGKPANDPKVGRVARYAFRNYVRYIRDVMIYPTLGVAELERRVRINGQEHLESILSMGKGAILVSAHFGNMDLPSAVAARRYSPMTLVAETLRPQQMMNYLTAMRSRRNVFLYPYDKAPRKMLEAIRRNEIIGMLLDFGVTHHLDIDTAPVRFFGTETQFPTGPAQLSRLTGAPIIVCHTRVMDNEMIEACLTEPIYVQRTRNRQCDIQNAIENVAGRFEQFISQSPDQWYIFRPMWGRNGKQ